MKHAELLSSIDGNVWAKEFMRLYYENIAKHEHLWIDEGAMRVWFCNAIMAGYDEAMRRANKTKGLTDHDKEN